MIDGIKTKNIVIPSQTELDWTLSVIEKTGETKNAKIAEYNGLKFIDKCNRVYIKGSLHKYHNNGLHNYNDFTLSDLQNVVKDLETRFGLLPENVALENVEFGVNIELPFNPNRVLTNLIMHKSEPFNRFQTGKGIECNHSQYFIKIYDKGAQYGLKKNLLRLEIKAFKMAYFQENGLHISKLSDLLIRENLLSLGEILKRTINEILFTDIKVQNNEGLTDKERLIIANGSNANYWHSLKPDSKSFTNGNHSPDYKRQRKHYYRELNTFEKTLDKYGSELKPLVVQKIGDKLTDLLPKVEFSEPIKKGDNLTEPQHVEGTNLHLVYNVSLSDTKQRQCLICGKDISDRKSNAKFCCKKCKNDYTNPLLNDANNLKKRVKKVCSLPSLFDINLTLSLTAQQTELLHKKNSIYSQSIIKKD